MSEITSPQQDNARSMHDPNVRYTSAHQIIKNYALEVCQLLFSVENPLGIIWSQDNEKTQINIVDKYAFNLDQVGLQPAIVANRGPIAWGKTSGFRQLQEMEFRTDKRTHTDLLRGSVNLSCLSRQGLEAEDIAGFVFESFQVFRDVLRKMNKQVRMGSHHLGYFRVESVTMGEEALVKSTSRPELSVVPVAITAMVQRRWAVVPRDARKLQDVTVRTNMGQP